LTGAVLVKSAFEGENVVLPEIILFEAKYSLVFTPYGKVIGLHVLEIIP
jgi:hypothetical protein